MPGCARFSRCRTKVENRVNSAKNSDNGSSSSSSSSVDKSATKHAPLSPPLAIRWLRGMPQSAARFAEIDFKFINYEHLLQQIEMLRSQRADSSTSALK